MNEHEYSCLIIGAGISGLVAARVLRERGVAVQLLDKARGVGGRLATRRFETADGQLAVYDHGAQFFTTRSNEFKGMVQAWLEAGVAREWFHGHPQENAAMADGHPRFCGTSGMTGIAKFLARELDVRLHAHITRIEATACGWKAAAQDGTEYSGDILLLTPPVPQSLALLDVGGVSLPVVEREQLERISYEPCIAVMIVLDGPGRVPEPGALHCQDGPLAWIADNYRKGVSPRAGAITLHATAPWSREHYADSDEEIIAALVEAAGEYLGGSIQTAQVRRWRYSKPERVFPASCLATKVTTNRETLPLIFAGDAWAKPRVEGAALSGLAAARAVFQEAGDSVRRQ